MKRLGTDWRIIALAAAIFAGCKNGDTNYSNASFSGAWLQVSSGVTPTNIYIVSDGAGTVTDTAKFGAAWSPATYSVAASGVLEILYADGSLTGIFDSPLRVIVTSTTASLWRVADTSLCAGTWTGQLVQDSPADTKPIAITVDSSGVIINVTGTDFTGPVTGYAFALTDGTTVIKCTTNNADAYSEFRLNGIITDTSMAGTYMTTTDTASPMTGTFNLAR